MKGAVILAVAFCTVAVSAGGIGLLGGHGRGAGGYSPFSYLGSVGGIVGGRGRGSRNGYLQDILGNLFGRGRDRFVNSIPG